MTGSGSETVDRRQAAYLALPTGTQGGAAARYAAAMHFRMQHGLSDAALEVFRDLLPFDDEDPWARLDRLGLAAPVRRLVADCGGTDINSGGGRP